MTHSHRFTRTAALFLARRTAAALLGLSLTAAAITGCQPSGEESAVFEQIGEARAASSTSRIINIVAHEDDDILFINPDIQADIAAGAQARTVFVTTGNQGCYQGRPFWMLREEGMKAAYAHMANVADEWDETLLPVALGCQFNGASDGAVAMSTLRANPKVSLVFLRLNSDYGAPGPYQLWMGEACAITNHDPSDDSCLAAPPLSAPALIVNRDQLTCLLGDVIHTYGADAVRTLDATGTGRDDGLHGWDHREHFAAASFAVAANKRLATPLLLTQYRGYNIQGELPNLSTGDASQKFGTFDTYAAVDTKEYGPLWPSNRPTESAAVSRRYFVGPFSQPAVNPELSTAATFRFADMDGNGALEACIRATDGVRCGFSVDESPRLYSFNQPAGSPGPFSNQSGWDPAQYGSTVQFGDVNGDGRADVCGRGGAGIWCALSTGAGFEAASLWTSFFSDAMGWDAKVAYYGSIRLADVNGDGKLDVCGRGGAGIWCALSTGAGFGAASLWTSFFRDEQGWGVPQHGSTMQLGDLNGDGKADVCGRGAAGIWCALSTGGSFGASSLWVSAFSNAEGWDSDVGYYGSIRLADVDGDGKLDVFGRGGAGILCARSTGSAFLSPQWVTSEFSDAKGWAPALYATTLQVVRTPCTNHREICGRGGNGIICSAPVF